MRIAIGFFSALLLFTLGLLGEAMLNLMHLGAQDRMYPAATKLAVTLFPMNGGYFIASMTSFMLLIVSAAMITKRADETRFLQCVFLTILAAMNYFAWFAWCVLLPFHVLADVIGECSTGRWVILIDLIIVAGASFLWTRRKRDAGSEKA